MEYNFWQRVDNLIEQRNVSRKELALSIGFDVSNIRKGILNNNIPAADTAVKIAKYLNTTVEYLVTGEDTSIPLIKMEEIEMYHKYSPTIHQLDSLPENTKEKFKSLISDVSTPFTSETESK